MKITLSETTINTLPVGKYYDAKCRGLLLSITPSSKRWKLYIFKDGKPIKRALGEWPIMSVKDAREKCDAVRVTPGKTKHGAPTLGEVFKAWRKQNPKGGWSDSVWRLRWSEYDGRKLCDVTDTFVKGVRDKVVGDYAKLTAIKLIKAVMRYGAEEGMVGARLLSRIKSDRMNPREVSLTEHELKVMRECLDEMAPDPRDFFILALITGLRRRNVSLMEHEWIDLDAATVTIPCPSSKNKKSMIIPLVPEAVEILRRRMVLDNRYIFPGRFGGAMTGTHNWDKDLKRRMREKGVTKSWHTHDLRRTAATRMNRAGVPLPVISQFLGHSSIAVTAIYARSDLTMVRDALMRTAVS